MYFFPSRNCDLSKPHHRNIPMNKPFTSKFLMNCLMNIIENIDMGTMGRSMPSWLGCNPLFLFCFFFSPRPPPSSLAAVCKVVSHCRSDLMKPQLMLMPAYDGKRTQTTLGISGLLLGKSVAPLPLSSPVPFVPVLPLYH